MKGRGEGEGRRVRELEQVGIVYSGVGVCIRKKGGTVIGEV